MTDILSSIGSVLTQILVILGALIIALGVIKTLWELARYQTKRKNKKNPAEELKQFSIIHSHLTTSIILALPLFIIKFIHDAVRMPSTIAYLYVLIFLLIFAVLIIFYKWDKKHASKK